MRMIWLRQEYMSVKSTNTPDLFHTGDNHHLQLISSHPLQVSPPSQQPISCFQAFLQQKQRHVSYTSKYLTVLSDLSEKNKTYQRIVQHI